jgi:hypothetical protein
VSSGSQVVALQVLERVSQNSASAMHWLDRDRCLLGG